LSAVRSPHVVRVYAWMGCLVVMEVADNVKVSDLLFHGLGVVRARARGGGCLPRAVAVLARGAMGSGRAGGFIG